MQKKTKIALAAAIVAVAGIGGVAHFAQAERGMGWRHGGPRAHMMDLRQRYDANQDGKISQEEIDQNRTAWHGEFDADKNGGLSLKEFEGLWLKTRHEQMVREFQGFDRDGDGIVRLDEYKTPTADLVAELDRNNDRTLDSADRPGPMMGLGWGHRPPPPGDDDTGSGPDGGVQ